MTVTTGSRLGPYEVTGQLGAGGMGEVYRARDARLDRIVAIKVLPPALSSDPRFRERFEREARAISSLNHPHICTLYDVGSQDGVDYLVMEYLEGESLAERLARGPLPVDQVLRYGMQIAEALEKAHRASIIHRDLKPGNVVLTKSGAKLLDFGLAKMSPATPFAQSDPHAATATMSNQTPHQKPLTEEGTIVGTFQYMAPEQIEGREADARTDLFAFGVLLYEMTTGKRAFDAKTRASLIASILDRDPPSISSILPLAPPALERVVKMCMAKDPDERWQSAHDVAAELRWIGASSSETIGPGARKRSRAALLRTVAFVTAALIGGALLTWLLTRGQPQDTRVARFAINAAPAPLLLANSALAISPDGTTFAYRGLDGTKERLYIRAIGSFAAVPVPGTEGAYNAAFSPDGRWLAFNGERAIYKIPREGGTRVKLVDSIGGLGLSWFGDTIYATRGFAGGVWAIPANGGESSLVAKADPAKQLRAITWPEMLPNGKTLLTTVWNVGSWDSASIVAFSLTDGASRVILQNGSFARYSPTGHLLFMRGGNLMAVTFDAETLETGSNAVAFIPGVSHGSADGEAQFAISAAGHLIYATGGDSEPLSKLVWTDQAGRQEPIVATKRLYGSLSLAADARSAVVTIESSTYDMWSLDFERDTLTRVSHGGDDSEGVITRDGSRVVWPSSRFGPYNLFTRPMDGSGAEERLTHSKTNQGHLALTPDGRDVLYVETGRGGDLWMMSLTTKKAQPLLTTQFNEITPAISPDGRWLAYSSDESGEFEVYITAYPKPGGKWQVSTDGGAMPRWMPDGRGIVYRDENKVLIAPMELMPRPRAGKPRVIVEGDYDAEYDIGPDGRIGLILSDGRRTATEFNFVLNFAEELKRRVPVR